jgi:hypothetical protein
LQRLASRIYHKGSLHSLPFFGDPCRKRNLAEILRHTAFLEDLPWRTIYGRFPEQPSPESLTRRETCPEESAQQRWRRIYGRKASEEAPAEESPRILAMQGRILLTA